VQPTIEAFDNGILHGLAWCDVMPALDRARIAVKSVRCRCLRRSSKVGDLKLRCRPNAEDPLERLKALAAADEISVVFERLAQRYRVIAFDRLGFGHTNQRRSRTWTPTAQAELVHRALIQLDIQQAIVGGIIVSRRQVQQRP
jgi:hypothetical protein